MKIIMLKGINAWKLVQMELCTWLTSTCNQASREEFSIKKTNFSVEEVKVYEKLEDDPYLVTHIFMELCDGSLFSYMKELNRKLSDRETLNFFCSSTYSSLLLA
ncbi:hypothetical protein ABFA07_019527 [Porites harrisoni]